MTDSRSNYSRLNADYSITLTADLVRAIRQQARLLLLPFFREIALEERLNDVGRSYLRLSSLGARILLSVYHEGDLDY